MDINNKVFGAKAKIFIKFNGSIQEIASILSKALFIKFIIEPSEYEPYHEVGCCEALGFEIWLEPTKFVNKNIEYNYLLKIETEDCIKETFEDNMYDLSLWLARFVTNMCGFETLVQV